MARLQRQTTFLDYDGFVEKFKPKKTTDDCYTPQPVYDAIASWVRQRIPAAKDCGEFLRPFYPGGDYEKEDYPDGCMVVDNPPFSILSKIVNDYLRADVGFFLFAPHLTLFEACNYKGVTAIVCDTKITYENGAKVNTSFLTNRWPDEDTAVLCGTLAADIKKANKTEGKTPRKHIWPKNVTTAALCGKYIVLNEDMSLPRSETLFVRSLDNGSQLFGSGLLISDRLADELSRAEQSRAEQSRAEQSRAEQLSPREAAIIEQLNAKKHNP